MSLTLTITADSAAELNAAIADLAGNVNPAAEATVKRGRPRKVEDAPPAPAAPEVAAPTPAEVVAQRVAAVSAAAVAPAAKPTTIDKKDVSNKMIEVVRAFDKIEQGQGRVRVGAICQRHGGTNVSSFDTRTELYPALIADAEAALAEIAAVG